MSESSPCKRQRLENELLLLIDDNYNGKQDEVEEVFHEENSTNKENEENDDINNDIDDVHDVLDYCTSVENLEENQCEETNANRNDDDNNDNDEDVDIDNDDDDDDEDINDDADEDDDHNYINDDSSDDDDVEYDDNYRDNIFDDDCHIQRAIRFNQSNDTIFHLIQLYPTDVTYKNKFGSYPLQLDAIYGKSKDIIIKLLELFPEAAQDKCIESGYYPLHYACRYYNHKQELEENDLYDDHRIIELIDIYPKAVMESTKYGTALHFACNTNKSIKVIAKLIEIYPLAIQIKDVKGRCPIHYAISGRSGRLTPQSIDIIKLLLDNDPLGIQRSINGWTQEIFVDEIVTPFHLACEMDNVDLVQSLLKRNDLQINIRDFNGKTTLHDACYKLRDTIVEVLLNHPNINVNAINYYNDTPLHKTLIKSFCMDSEKQLNILQQLLNHPFIIIDMKNNDNKTVLDLALERLHQLQNNNNNERTTTSQKEIEVQRVQKMVHLLEEFPIKQRWQSYCYHAQEFSC